MSAQKLLIGVLSGLVAGVAIGLLTAPAKGSDTRKKIADTADDIKQKLRHLRGQANNELDELKAVLENETSGLRDDVRERILKLVEASKNSYHRMAEDAKMS
ncbi:MAG: YtxH domain-containing protein [Hydrotalea flava]|uniref:YtxH domain-containing protein n=1 Tax=Hydrotalea flava TaxID=714549 RepID=UPI000832B780|nr:YtxH domain-containing protein [Hydrotalea flava]RTL56941.1 MAG: YtxH domain-containing protein [Sphingobacteriales bacterium]NIM35613.1 YtxH domain-containing protein [Hydrotalea flava]NIM38472.1 YtxH domain-containing protein [Hydrotalea flava]NIN03995.1 YtxH domain-containing protein [Hydrotalea flava]NIN15329.1 YtxH domain-containing protein [Hydrotalea flava]